MADVVHSATEPVWDIGKITDNGERITHLYPNDCYYAHLSIYYFAKQFVQNKLVLDAGSGAGYGSPYLARNGARAVYALEVSAEAVEFSQYHFQAPNLSYTVMDLQQITGFEPGSADVIFSSNVLEHIPDVLQFLRKSWELLTHDGVLVVAVPPIISEDLQANNLANPYHLNIWTPLQWHHVLSCFFADIQYYQHTIDKPGVTLDFANSPEQTVINEEDFLFKPIPLEQATITPTLTAVFVARKPLASENVPADLELTFIDDSFTIPANDRVAQTMSAHLAMKMQEIQQLQAQIRAQDQIDHLHRQQQRRIAQLEAQVAAKNAHILYLEGWLRRIESGRIMRSFRLLQKLRTRYLHPKDSRSG